jgi:hypothetical protein
MCKVRLRTSFTQGKAAPLYTENVLTLAPTNGVIRESRTRECPAEKAAPPAAAPAAPSSPSGPTRLPLPARTPVLPAPSPAGSAVLPPPATAAR